MNRLPVKMLFLAALVAAAGCSSIRVKLSGDRGVRYQAVWTTAAQGTTTRSGTVPESFSFKEDMTGWFQNATGNGTFRVRIYEGMGLLVDETIENSGRRVVIERKGGGVSYRVD